MFFMIGINQDRKDLEFTQVLTCEECGSLGRMSVFMVCTVLSLFLLPVFRWDRHYYVQMSCCGSLYELDPAVGKAIENGYNPEIKKEDLTLIRSNASVFKKCIYCGYETAEDFEFCPKCGNRF